MKDYFYLKKGRQLLFALLVLLAGGASPAWADAYTCGFEASDGWSSERNSSWIYYVTPPSDWGLIGEGRNLQISTTKNSGSNSLYCSTSNTVGYVVSPKLAAGTISFYGKRNDGSGYLSFYKAELDGNEFKIVGDPIKKYTKTEMTSTSSWYNFSFELDEDAYIAILLNYYYIDDFSASNGLATESGSIAKPTNFTASNTTYNSTQLSWTAGGEETAWELVYSTDASFDKDAVEPIEITTNPYTLTGLNESTTYYAYLRAKSGEDVSAWTSKISFSTPAQYPAPTGLTASEETTTTATLSWTKGGEETSWQISYSVNSDFSESTEITANSTSKSLTGLTANTTYYVKVRADYGSDNYSAWTNAISFKTLQEAQSAGNWLDDFEGDENWTFINGTHANKWAIGSATNNGGTKSLYISNDDGTTFNYNTSDYCAVYASKLFSFSAGEYIISYDWRCYAEKGRDFMRVVLVPANAELTAGTSLYSGLTKNAVPSGWIAADGGSELSNSNTWANKSVNVTIPSNANYYIVFAWYNDYSGGAQYPAAIDNFAIRINDTPNPTNLSVTDITTHAGTLSWDNTDNTWEVYHSTSSTEPAVDQTPTASPATNSYTFTGLDSETKYYVWVRSVSKSNASNKSAWVGTYFTTDIAAVAPTEFTASSITATGATLSWTAGADETKWDLVYGLYNDPSDVRNTTVEVNTTPSKTITGLISETIYYAFVRAKKGEEVSTWVSTSFEPTASVQLTINDDTDTNAGIPVYGYFADNAVGHSQFIIPATDITAIDGGIIKKLTFYASQTTISWVNASYTPTFKVYIKEVADTEFSSLEFVEWNTLTEVYSGILSVADNQMLITLDTPFEFNGGNLLIGVNETVRGNYVSSTWYGVTTSGNTAIMQSGSYSPKGPAYASFLPKTTFTYIPVTGAKMQINKTAIDFGSVTSVPQQETFTISNSKGVVDLTNIEVNITGTDAAAYSVSALPRTTITTTGETAADIELTVTFNPAAGGTYDDATITINADDQEEKTIALTGTYIANPEIGVFNDELASESAMTGQTINFGYVQTSPTYTYYIKNTGVGTLDVAVNDGGLTVSPANASLAEGEQQAFTITANVAEADATVIFTGTNHDGGAEVGTFNVTLQGTVMPLTSTFFEGFNYEDGNATTTELDGWEVNNNNKNITFNNGYICYWASGSESGNVISPKLRVSGTSDILRISAYLKNKNYNNTLLSISYSADKTNWTEAFSKGKNDLETTAKDFEISGIPEGSYYFKIEMSDVAVDYFYGFSTTHPDAETLAEDVAPSFTTGVKDVTLKHSFVAGWNTICLPFTIDATDIHAEAKALAFTAYDEVKNELTFSPVTEQLTASKPYVIYVPEDISVDAPFTFLNASIASTTASDETFNGVTFQGTYDQMEAGSLDGMWGLTANGKIVKADDHTTMKGFRGYFNNVPADARVLFIGYETTGISIITVDNSVESVYNLKGQKVEKTQKGGLYIINGKKVVMK